MKKMLKSLVRKNKKGVICGCAVAGFILSSCALISIMTIKSAIAICLAMISIVCLGIVKQLIYIKLR
jgi:hypothetical protein|tara:strand:+ start:201 stop:401 length:201 start_codon:yes stop_codon:yes gene_type:complete